MNVICFGDSNTYGFDPRSYFGSRYPSAERWVDILSCRIGWNIYNEGMNGREVPMQGISVPEDTDLLIVMLGTNDLLQGKQPIEIADTMKCFLSETICGHILLIAPPHLRVGEWVADSSLISASSQLSVLYGQLASEIGVGFADAEEWNIDILFDGVHFSQKGHRSFAEGLYELLTHSCLNEGGTDT